MISSLRGTILQITLPDQVILEVGGVGFKVLAPASVIEELEGIGRTAFLYTHLIVREDALTLYGFSSEDQRGLFELLLTVQGVGPKLALAVLSALSLDVLRRAVAQEQPEVLERVRGVGKKTAEKIVFALKDKLRVYGLETALRPVSEGDTEVLAALTALGYSVDSLRVADNPERRGAKPNGEKILA